MSTYLNEVKENIKRQFEKIEIRFLEEKEKADLLNFCEVTLSSKLEILVVEIKE